MLRNITKIILISFVFSLSTLSYAKNTNHLTAHAWLVADKSNNIIVGENTNEIRSIASITKLMTAMVVLDDNQSLEEIIPKKIYGVNLTRRQLLTFAIVKSDNNAAHMLCEFYSTGLQDCIDAMNQKAHKLGMYNTTFSDPTGIMHTNQSTANDLVKLLNEAAKYEVIREDSNTSLVTWRFGKKRSISFRNTNPIVGEQHFMVSKTGYISKAGGCIAMLVDTIHGPMSFIILGSKTIRTRIPEARIILAKHI